MASNTEVIVALSAMLLPRGTVMVEMREFHMDKVRVDSSQPTEAEVAQAVNIVGKLTPEKQLRWMLQTIYKHPFIAARVRIELKVRQHRLKQLQWRAKTAENRRKANLRAKASRAERLARERAEMAAAPPAAAAVKEGSTAASSSCGAQDSEIESLHLDLWGEDSESEDAGREA